MNKWLVRLLILISFALSGIALAQDNPTISRFIIDRAAISVADAEAGKTLANFIWETNGMSDTDNVRIDRLLGSTWQNAIPASAAPLPPNGQITLPIQHPQNFNPPTYRLGIFNQAGLLIAENTTSIPYEQPNASPQIARLFVGEAGSPSDLENGSATLQARWTIAGRVPMSNIRFVQVMEDGSRLPVPAPYNDHPMTDPNDWAPSQGSALLKVHAPQVKGNPVHLRLQVYSIIDNNVYTESPEVTRNGILDMEVREFSVTPTEVDHDGSVTITWDVSSDEIDRFFISVRHQLEYYYGEDSPKADSFPMTGSVTYTVPDLPLPEIRIMPMFDETHAVTVKIRCQYQFFVQGDSPNPCPSGPPQDLPAVYQPFEKGFVVMFSGAGSAPQIWVFTGTPNKIGGLVTYPGTENPKLTPPKGLFTPMQPFAATWKRWQTDNYTYDDVGWATAPEQSYTMRMQSTLAGAYKEQGSTWNYLTLPDGRVVSVYYSNRSFSLNGSILPH